MRNFSLFDLRTTPEISKTLFYIIENIILIPMALFWSIINLFFHIKFVRLVDTRVGHLAANTDLFLRRLKLDIIKDGKTKYIGIASNKPCNEQLLKMIRRVMTIIQIPKFMYDNILFGTLSNSRSLLNKLGLYKDLILYSNEYYEFNNTEPSFHFTSSEEKKGKELLKKMKVKNWFVCFHARDSAYLPKIANKTPHYFRDCDINNYLEAAKYIASKGGYALRMGAIVEKKLGNLKNKRIIDYATFYRTDFGDIYLPAKCKFFLGSSAGITLIGSVFHVPCIISNQIPMVYPPFREGELYIPKKIWSIKKKRFLTFKEIMNSGIINYYDSDLYKKAGLKVVENTSEEILDLAKEMNERLDGTWITTKKDEELQRKFRVILDKNPRCHGFPSRIGMMFLRKNKELLE